MFMRFRGGGVGHKTMREETQCLLDDRDKLDKVPFIMESEMDKDQMELDDESDKEEEDSEDEEEDEDDEEESKDGNEMDEDEEDEESGIGNSSAALANEELVDEMDEFGYSGLDQVIEEFVEEELLVEEDGLGAEDGENVGDNEDEDDLYADL